MTGSCTPPVKETTNLPQSIWQHFDYANPPDGLFWLDIERPETWFDAGPDGRTIGGYTGQTLRLVVLAIVYTDKEGPTFGQPDGADFSRVEDSDVVRRFAVLSPPEVTHG